MACFDDFFRDLIHPVLIVHDDRRYFFVLRIAVSHDRGDIHVCLKDRQFSLV